MTWGINRGVTKRGKKKLWQKRERIPMKQKKKNIWCRPMTDVFSALIRVTAPEPVKVWMSSHGINNWRKQAVSIHVSGAGRRMGSGCTPGASIDEPSLSLALTWSTPFSQPRPTIYNQFSRRARFRIPLPIAFLCCHKYVGQETV